MGPSVEQLVMDPTAELSGARCRGRWRSCRTNPNPNQVALVPYASGSATERAREALSAMDRYPIADGALMAVAGNEEDMRARAARAATGLDADADAAFAMLAEMEGEEGEGDEGEEEEEEDDDDDDDEDEEAGVLRSIASIFDEDGEEEEGEEEEGGEEDA
jgi:hypothetical protein